MLNFLGMLKAPVEPSPMARYVASYSNGFGLLRREIEAPNRLVAYSIATNRPPEGYELTQLRRQRQEARP